MSCTTSSTIAASTNVLFYAWIYSALTRVLTEYAPWLQLRLVDDLPYACSFVALIFAFDFFHYWKPSPEAREPRSLGIPTASIIRRPL
jgi:hypothetical protein